MRLKNKTVDFFRTYLCYGPRQRQRLRPLTSPWKLDLLLWDREGSGKNR